MQRSICFHRPSTRQFWFSLATACWLVLAAPGVDPDSQASAQTDAKPRAGDDKVDQDKAKQDREPVFSGPQPGETIKPFKVLRVTADEVKEVEIVDKTKDRTTLICFIHRLSNDDRILFGLGLVDFYVSRFKNLDSHFVLLAKDRVKITTMLQAWARGPLFTKSMVTLSSDGVEGPGYYGLNRNVAMTVLVAKGDRVVHNMVFQAPNQRDLQKIMAAVAKTLDKPEPELSKVQHQLRDERQKRAEMRLKASPVFKLAPNEQLGRTMFYLVNARGNRIQNAKRRGQQLADWAGDDKARQSELKKYCKAVLSGGFNLNQYSRAAIVKLAGD